jgi:hypothetical protein
MSKRKYLRFDDLGSSASGKTRIWRVQNAITMSELGCIVWQAGWRRYVFCPRSSTVYDAGCLREIAAFIEQQMEARL